jgi:cytosine/adenosine deaminase-related metal-dependent hydrolase
MMKETITLYRAAGVYDAAGVWATPGVIAVQSGRVIAAGQASDVRAKVADSSVDAVVDLSDRILLPAMVNAHAHLDLSLVGSLPYGGDFIGWIEQVMRHRATQTHSVTDAVRHGLRLSREGGVGWIGDIAGTAEAIKARANADGQVALMGVSWIECIGRGERAKKSFDSAMETTGFSNTSHVEPLRIGLEAHAPYSTGESLYKLAGSWGTAATHLAETLDEERFVRHADGAFAEFLRKIDRWDESIKPTEKSPVRWFTEVIAPTHAKVIIARWVAAHCNYVSNDDITALVHSRVSVAYCPIASEYFHHPVAGREPHRYREMIDAGINVCLGTDSIICQPPSETQPMSIFAAARRLYARDGYDPKILLEMSTTNGLRAMGLDSKLATFTPVIPAKIIAVRIDPTDPRDPLQQALLNRYPVEPIVIA